MRRAMLAAVTAAALACSGGVLLSGDAFGVTMSCSSTFSGTFTGDVSVPAGATCNLQGATINGNVSVNPGGRLIVGGGTTINGNLASTNAGTASANVFGTGVEAFSVIVCNSRVTGKTSVTGSASQVLLGGTSSTGGVCGGNNFGNNVSLQNNHGRVTLSGNSGTCAAPGRTCGIAGNALVASNTPGPVRVTNNVIAGNLTCFSNAPVTSTGNTVGGNKTGQCPA